MSSNIFVLLICAFAISCNKSNDNGNRANNTVTAIDKLESQFTDPSKEVKNEDGSTSYNNPTMAYNGKYLKVGTILEYVSFVGSERTMDQAALNYCIFRNHRRMIENNYVTATVADISPYKFYWFIPEFGDSNPKVTTLTSESIPKEVYFFRLITCQ